MTPFDNSLALGSCVSVPRKITFSSFIGLMRLDRMKNRWSSIKAGIHTSLFFWPALSLIAIVMLWTMSAVRTANEHATLEQTAVHDAASSAEAYEHFLSRSIGQMDQITMQLKFQWEHSREKFRFEELNEQGVFTDATFISVSIYDREGALQTSTKIASTPTSLAKADFFAFHKNNISTALKITIAPVTQASRRFLQFSRRLDGPDDTFDGMVVLNIDPGYFTSFYSVHSLGNAGLVSMVLAESDGRIEKDGNGMQGLGPIVTMPLSTFRNEDEAGVWTQEPYSGGQQHFLAWKRSRSYPFIAVVGLSRAEIFSSLAVVSENRDNNSLLGTFALLMFATVATRLSWRLKSRQKEQEAIRAAYRKATEQATDGFYLLLAVQDDHRRITDFQFQDCNEQGASFFGAKQNELLGKSLSSVTGANLTNWLIDRYARTEATGTFEEEMQTPSDSVLRLAWINYKLARAGDSLAITLQDISRHKLHEQQLLRLANEDALTGLPNRYWLNQYLPNALVRAETENSAMALLFIDLDGFKHVNDTQGHAIGDGLLKVAASRLTALLRPSDHVVRFGGDEFIVILSPLESKETAAVIARRVLDAFEQPFDIGDEIQLVGASVGISLFPTDGADAATLITHGDIAMYSGKSEGKGQYRFYEPMLYERLTSKAQHKQALLDALERDQFVLHFQPRVDARTGELCSMEALVRWIHPERGMIPPLDFIPQAEANGLILKIGEIVMEKACRQIAQWRQAGLKLVPVSINVSPFQFIHGNVHHQLARYMCLHDVEPDLLEVEITESAMMEDQYEVLTELSAIRALGIKLHIDDFGTGYSSLSQLQKLKMDVLKVDRAFTVELGNSRDGKIFFQAIVSMAHALGMTVVAEGVETAEQLAILQELKCNEIQGYLISRPVPAFEMGNLMSKRFLFPVKNQKPISIG